MSDLDPSKYTQPQSQRAKLRRRKTELQQQVELATRQTKTQDRIVRALKINERLVRAQEYHHSLQEYYNELQVTLNKMDPKDASCALEIRRLELRLALCIDDLLEWQKHVQVYTRAKEMSKLFANVRSLNEARSILNGFFSMCMDFMVMDRETEVAIDQLTTELASTECEHSKILQGANINMGSNELTLAKVQADKQKTSLKAEVKCVAKLNVD